MRISIAALLALAAVTGVSAQNQAATGGDPVVKMDTSLGAIYLELNAAKAPISTENFVRYVKEGFYQGTIFHRIMPTFMIQGGGYLPDLSERKDGLREPIKNEWQNGLKNTRGTIAMARTQVPDSATAQFYINVVNNAMLDQPQGGAAYAVFGRVIVGMDVVDKIKAVETKIDPKLPMGKVVPVEPVVIKGATLVSAEERAKLADLIKQEDEKLARAEAEAKAAAEAAAREKEKQLAEVIAKIEQEAGKKAEKTASGLMYVTLKEGAGAQPKPEDTIDVHYTGWLVDGTKVDSSVDRGKPATRPLNKFIKGWIEGVGMMKVGEKRKFIIPPDLGYGAGGRGSIPPNAWLIFEIELLGIKP